MLVLEQNDPPVVTAVEPGSAAAIAGIRVGDQIVEVDGTMPRDIIEWHVATDEKRIPLVLRRGDSMFETTINRETLEPIGLQISSSVFDRVKTCDNHCDFCFIYQLPKGLRPSLYLKDDDYRLSFLYGNFTTLTRFTESDFERVITEHISPLNVSIHTFDPQLRASMLRNERGAVSLRWLRELLKQGIDVRGQVVLCPGVNDGPALDRTLAMVLDQYASITTIAVVPLGLSKYNPESNLRVHTQAEASRVLEQVDQWRAVFMSALGRPLVYAADELFLVAGRDLPARDYYGDFEMYEDGIGMIRQLEIEYRQIDAVFSAETPGFFHNADVAHRYGADYSNNPASETGLRRVVEPIDISNATLGSKRVIFTGVYGAAALHSVIGKMPEGVRVVAVQNEFFGGNTAVTGLMTGSDINRELRLVSDDEQVFVPDVCLSAGRFLDGMTLDDLIRDILVVPTDGHALRRIVEG